MQVKFYKNYINSIKYNEYIKLIFSFLIIYHYYKILLFNLQFKSLFNHYLLDFYEIYL